MQQQQQWLLFEVVQAGLSLRPVRLRFQTVGANLNIKAVRTISTTTLARLLGRGHMHVQVAMQTTQFMTAHDGRRGSDHELIL